MQGQSALNIASVFLYGIRFDIYSIVITNALFILGHIIPNKKFYTHPFQQFLKLLFYAVNIPALLISCIDFEYFAFTRKRTTSDLFTPAMAGDIRSNLGIYIKDFWFLLLILALFVIIMQYLYRRTSGVTPQPFRPVRAAVLFVIASGVFVIAARGGLQFKPIGMQTAAQYVPQKLIPAVTNTPFAIIKTLGKKTLEEVRYFPSEKADEIFPVAKEKRYDLPMRKLNVMIIIMESFSKEYIGFFNEGRGYTPFLDSLCRHSLVFSNAYANAKRSIEGIPAITASLPHLMDEAFISSIYNTNSINSIAGILRKEGYSSGFFHGGNNGTMGLESFSRFAGFEKYFGRNEYIGNKADYDGNWGIFDEPFFAFVLKQLNSFQKPFCATVFSLSSHHPYTIPEQFANVFPKGPSPIHESIGYADHALRTFFEAAGKQSWFDSTLFVITADHTGPAVSPAAMTSKGIFEVPLIFYCPADSLQGINRNTAQHADILPSILDYLRYSGKFASFGESVFNNPYPFAVTYTNNIYQGIDNKHVLLFDAVSDTVVSLFDHIADPLLTVNIYNENKADPMLEMKTKAAIQQFRSKMSENSIVN